MISKKDIEYVAALSRIQLKSEEVNSLTADLERILQYVNKLNTLDVSGIDPTTHVAPLQNVYRDDTVQPSLSQEETLKISVEQHQGAFKVPKVIE